MSIFTTTAGADNWALLASGSPVSGATRGGVVVVVAGASVVDVDGTVVTGGGAAAFLWLELHDAAMASRPTAKKAT